MLAQLKVSCRKAKLAPALIPALSPALVPAASAAQTNSWPTTVYLGASSGLSTGQVLRLRQLVGWALTDQPSAAGAILQARLAA